MGYLLQDFVNKYGHRLGRISAKGADFVLVRCPLHDDHAASLSIYEKDGQIKFKCHTGCSEPFIYFRDTFGMVQSDWRVGGRTTPWVETARYDYGTKVHVRKERYVDGKREKQMPWENRDGTKSSGGNEGIDLYVGNSDIFKNGPVFIVEGEKCVDALSAIGLASATNPGGASESRLDRYAIKFKDRVVYVLPDNDTAGERHAEAWIAALNGVAKSAWIVRIPGLPPKGDVADWVAEGGTADELLATARSASPIAGLVSGAAPDWARERAMEVIRNGWPKGLSLGLGDSVDELIRFHPSQFVVVTGIPSAAKSTLLETIAVNAMRQGVKSAFFPGESATVPNLISLLQKGENKSIESIRSMDEFDVDYAMEQINESIFRIDPPVGHRGVDTLCAAMEYAATVRGAKLLVFDPWSTIEKNRDARLSETEFIGATLPKLVKLAQDTEATVVLVAHPRKIERQNSGNYVEPSLYDISGSAHFFNFADVGIVVHRTWEDNRWKNTLRVAKVRNAWQGTLGKTQIIFNTASTKFMEVDRSW